MESSESAVSGVVGRLLGPRVQALGRTLSARCRHAWHRVPSLLRRRGVSVAFGALLLLGLGARWEASRWELPYLAHWDEPFIANRALEILRTGDFNPRFFNYGSLVVYLDAAVDVLHYYRLVGLPEDDPRHLRSPQEIRFRGAREDPLVTAPEREPYWVSHPSFYLWNRRLTALFGAAAIALAFHLARRLAGDVAGLVAAGALATSRFHIEQSALVTTDVPAATLALGVLAGTLSFTRGGPPRRLLIGGFLLGLAIGTKYNSAIVGLVPAAALTVATLRRWPNGRPWLWAALPGVAALGFLVSTPYALLDLPAFLEQSGRMISGYVAGQGLLFEVAPGWPHLALDLREFARQWGPVTSLAIAAGLLLALRRPLAWIVLPIGPLVLLATSRTMAPFHRNVVLCYPLAAIALGILAEELLKGGRARPWRHLLAVGLMATLLVSAAGGLSHAGAMAGQRDSRSLVTDWLDEHAEQRGLEAVAIPSELAVHELDLARLRLPLTIAPFDELVCSPVADRALLLPTRPTASIDDLLRSRAEQLTKLVASQGVPLETIAPENSFPLDSPVSNPGIALFAPQTSTIAPLACAAEGVPLSSLRAEGSVDFAPGRVALRPGARLETTPFLAPRGRSLVSLRVSAAEGAHPQLTVVVSDLESGRELGRLSIKARHARRFYEISFDCAAPTPIRVRIEVPPAATGSTAVYGLWMAPAPG